MRICIQKADCPTTQRQQCFGDQAISVMFCHQDQGAKAPPATSLLIASQQSPLAGFVHGFPTLSVQFHPEFGPDYEQSLLDGKLHRDMMTQGFARCLRRYADPAAPPE